VAPPRILARVVAPLVNTNEPEARVVEVGVAAFGPVAAGQVICVLETSKSTEEVVSEHDGWIGPLHVALFDDVSAGSLICEVFDAEPPRAAPGEGAAAAGAGPRLTRRAAAIAAEAGVDLALLPTDRFVTEDDVRELIARTAPAADLDPAIRDRAGAASVVVFGGGGLGTTLIEIIAATPDLEALCVVDDAMAPGTAVLGVPVAGGRGVLAALAGAGAAHAVNGVGAIGRAAARAEIDALLAGHGFSLPALRHPAAVVAPSATLGPGTQVHAGAVVSTGVTIGRGVIVNSGAIASHDCAIGDHVHLAPGAVLAGSVRVGDGALVGMAATVALGLAIGARALVGNGAVITGDVPDGAIVAAGTVWP
jgi:sugar O-acyltransferase (sialic acid O-acetyltransferase NeuD family)